MDIWPFEMRNEIVAQPCERWSSLVVFSCPAGFAFVLCVDIYKVKIVDTGYARAHRRCKML